MYTTRRVSNVSTQGLPPLQWSPHYHHNTRWVGSTTEGFDGSGWRQTTDASPASVVSIYIINTFSCFTNSGWIFKMDPYLPRHGDGPHSQVSTRYSSQHLRTVDIRLEDLNSEDISGLVDEGRFGETRGLTEDDLKLNSSNSLSIQGVYKF